MKRIFLALQVLTLGMLFVSSCNDPSPLGAELIEGDQANIIYADTITFWTSSVKEDSVVVYDPNPSIQYSNFFVGDYEDPVFGKVKANLVAQLWPDINAPDFKDAVLDSLVLLLRYDSIYIYGDLVTDPCNIRVSRLEEDLDIERKYYSNESFLVNMTPLGETGDFYPRYSSADTLEVLDYSFPPNVDTLSQAAHLRIRLSDEFGMELMDSMFYETSATFLEQFNGIVVEGINTTKGILSFNLLSSLSKMILYYHTDTIYQQYDYVFTPSGVYLSTFENDYAGSIVDPFLDTNDKTKGDSLIFIQSMSGPNIKIEFPNVEELGDVIVNKAELKLTFAELEGDDMEVYTPLRSSIAVVTDDVNGGFAFTSDVILGLLTPTNNYFGGTPRETLDDQGNPITEYSFNISSHFQDMIEGSAENTIFIRGFPKQERSSRSVFYGPKNSKYPATFELTYTKLDP